MEKFSSYLFEARRNADIQAQQKRNALDIIEKYKDDPKIHISYTSLPKIGINPKSKFPDTPLAVYAYPLKEIWNDINSEGISNVYYGSSEAKYIFILREKETLTDVSKYTSSNLKSDMTKIEKIITKPVMDELKQHFETDSWASQVKRNYEISHPYSYLQIFLYVYGNRTSKRHFAPPVQSSILLKLGYKGFSDRTGLGEIHPAEPIQSYFLSPKYYEVVERIDITVIDKKAEGNRSNAEYLKKNASKMSDDEIVSMVRDDITLLRYAGAPRTEVLKKLIDIRIPERWTTRRPEPEGDYNDKMYRPAESSIGFIGVLYYYKKLPNDFIKWMFDTQIENKSFGGFMIWLERSNMKISDSFLSKYIDKSFNVVEAMKSIDLNTAKKIMATYGANKLFRLTKKISEKDMYTLYAIAYPDLKSIIKYLENAFGYEPTFAKYAVDKLVSSKTNDESEIFYIAGYIQRGRTSPGAMDLVEKLKSSFPATDFTQVGRWDFWKR